jgi:hypothetical protein
LADALLKSSGIIRTGFDYQDLIGIELLIEFFRDPDRYHWIELESEEPNVGYLDDVVAARTDGAFELIQVKFTVDRDRYFLDWDWLLEKRPNGTSLLEKWSSSLNKATSLGKLYSARLRTNRRPDEEFAKCLNGPFVALNRLETSRRKAIEVELGGRQNAEAFCAQFEFCHSEATIDDFEFRLKASIVPTDTDNAGWLLLVGQARRWAVKRNEPEPDGHIRHNHLVQIITKKRPKPIPQDFQVPAVYSVPSSDFHDAFTARIKNSSVGVSILWGTPGRGKSTYLSYLMNRLAQARLPTIRHHYFLSLDDTTSDRISFPDIASSLMDQMVARYPDAVKGLEEDSNQLRKWIEAAATHFVKEGKKFFVVIDGLDHVWRERLNIAQMDQLFNHLLPVPPHVGLIVGTQRVPDSQLPHRLLQHAAASDWIEIPAMNEGAVQAWIMGQHEAGRIRLADRVSTARDKKEELGAIGRAFYDISQGHPLHLIYSFEALVRRGAVFTADDVTLLPPCPEGDIRKYYNGLWGRLSVQAKQILHAIAGTDFHWPVDGLRQCFGAIDDVDHLLERRRAGIIPFHGSILAYARERVDHEETYHSLLPRIVQWLEEDAPEYWRWGWLWLTKAQNGDCSALLGGATRQWAILSLAYGWPAEQIVSILRAAERKAFDAGDYAHTFTLRSIKTRVQNGPEFQMARFAEFQECAIKSAGNARQILAMADSIPSLGDEGIVTLARIISEELRADIGLECTEEMRRRVNLWLNLRHRPGREFISLVKHFIEALALSRTVNVKAVMRFVRGFHDQDNVFEWLLQSLMQTRDFENLLGVARDIRNSGETRWLSLTHDALVFVAATEGINLTARLSDNNGPVSPVLACWRVLQEPTASPTLIGLSIPPNLMREHYDYGRNADLESFLHGVFFLALATALKAEGEFSLVLPGFQRQKSARLDQMVELLTRTARRIASKELAMSFSTAFSEAETVAPAERATPSDPARAQYQAFKVILRQIAIHLHCLQCGVGGSALITKDELESARASAHWNDDAWLSDDVERQLRLLEPSAAVVLLETAVGKESRTVTVFNERTDKWTELARFAMTYGIGNPKSLITRAAGCLLGYGWRKDLWITDVLDSIADVHAHQAADAMPWLRTLVPIVDQITVFTDGDETDYARSELIELIAKVVPDRLPAFYSHHIAQDEWRYARETSEAHMKIIDVSSVTGTALARTILERPELSVLAELRNAGDQGASRAEANQIRYLGGLPPDRERHYGNRDEPGPEGVPPDVTQYGPPDFKRLIEDISDHRLGYDEERELQKRWLDHWTRARRGVEALHSIRKYFDDEENPYPAEALLDDAFLLSLELEGKTAAYPWLVTAHIHRHGWGHWTSSAEVLRRLEWAANHYKDRWREYISDTSRQSRYWERRTHSFTIGTKYLVHFLLLVGQDDLAARFAEACVRIVKDEVSDQPIRECPWFH